VENSTGCKNAEHSPELPFQFHGGSNTPDTA